jgi:hypothetical protein
MRGLYMKFTIIPISITLLISFSVRANSKNLCDELIESGKSSDATIKKCLDNPKFGKSEYYLEQEKKKKWQQETADSKSAEEAAKKANVQSKKFTQEELSEAGMGKLFFAIKVDYSNPRKPKNKRITNGDALCKYLGYEKVLKSTVTPEIMPKDAHENGLIIDTSFLGVDSDTPELFKDNNINYTILAYHEITCAKVISKDVAGASDVLAKVVEDIGYNEPTNITNPGIKDDVGVDNGPRKPANKQGTTPHGYTREKPESTIGK